MNDEPEELTAQLLREIKRKGSTRASIATLYAQGITLCRLTRDMTTVDWPAVNHALLERYRPSGLDAIKRAGWNTSDGELTRG